MSIHTDRYDHFITERKLRTLPDNTPTENHHILPKSLGGTDSPDNLITLSIREHYIAHLILWKAFGGKMSTAFHNMINFRRYKIYMTSRQYSELREDFINSMSGDKHPFYGKHHSADTKKLMSETRKGMPSHRKGKKLSKSHTNNIKTCLKGNAYREGKLHSEESKKKISEAITGNKNPFYGKKHSPETIAKLRAKAIERARLKKELLLQQGQTAICE